MRSRQILLLIPLVLVSASLAAPQPETSAMLPATPAGRQFAAWLDMLNSGDAAVFRRFISERFSKQFLGEIPLDEHVNIHTMVHTDAPGLTARKVEDSKEHDIAVVCESPQLGSWFRVRMEVEPQTPHAIRGVGIMVITRPPDLGPQGKLSDAEIVKDLEEFLDKLVKTGRFSGAVMVARDGKPLFRRAYGLAERSFQVPNRVDTKFNLGSMNKMFTAVAAAQLVEQGKMAFSDTVGKHLPDWPNKAVAEKVTIHHLLTHTSGMGSYFNKKYEEASKTRFRAVRDYFPLFADDPLEFEPGARFGYSNSGFMLLGAIIEKVSGQDYFDYVREHIYKPAGMVNTDAFETDRVTPNLATGYTRMGPDGKPDPGGWRNNLFLHVVKGGPAGGGFSTVEDLVQFAEALRGNKLLSREMTETVLTGKVDTGRGEGRYAYGFLDERAGGERIAGHGGGFPGISAQLDIYLDQGVAVAVLSNVDQGAQRVSMRLRDLLTRK